MPPRGRPRGPRGGRGATARGGAQSGKPAEQPAAAESSTPDTPSETVMPAAAPQPAAPLSSATPAPSSSATRGTRGRFKPKVVRRAEEERIKLAEDYKKIDAAYYKEEQKATRSRGRGRGRGRGGFMRGALRASTALGPLSAGLSFGGGSSGSGGHGGYGASNFLDNNRINADMLYAVPVEPAKEVKVKGGLEYTKRQVLLPMGIRREEHREEEITIANTADIEAQNKGVGTDQADDDALFVDQERPATRQPDQDGEVWEHSLPKRRAVKGEGYDMMELDDIPEDESKTKASKPQKAKTEDELLAEDLLNMVQLFTIGQTDSDKKGSEAMSLEGHMFLFQFPPVLPPLEKATQTADELKPDPGEDDDSDIVFAPKKPPVTVDLTEGADKVKTEDDAEVNNENQDNSSIVKEAGFVGNLVVRKSGKVELSWGGQTLLLAPGTQSNFLSTAVLVEEGHQSQDFQGAAFGMGRIQGSFALVPPWDDEQGWDVDPDELVVPDE